MGAQNMQCGTVSVIRVQSPLEQDIKMNIPAFSEGMGAIAEIEWKESRKPLAGAL
jgi:hypothetical protein